MKNQLFEVFVCMLLIGTCFVVALDTVSAEDLVDGDYTYTLSKGETTITKYTGAGGAITIPSTLGGYPTVHIGDRSFKQKNSLASVTIPSSVTSIGIAAFSECSSLASVTLPNSVITIENGSFYKTSLTSLIIPKSVTTIGLTAFFYCDSLTAINVDAANVNYASVDGVLYNKAITTLIRCPDGKAGTFTIPSSVTAIEQYAIHSCSFLTSVIIGNSVTTIGEYAFSGCESMTSVTIGSSVTTIRGYAFDYCSNLISIRFLGLVAPISVYYIWIRDTPAEIRGHAYADSNFPALGGVWNGLTMGTVIGEENEPPSAAFTWMPSNPTTGQLIRFDASSSNDSDGSITLYEWDWNNDGVFEASYDTPVPTQRSWSPAASYPVTLRVTDDGGLTSTKTLSVTIVSGAGNDNTNGNGDTDSKGTPGFEIIIIIGAIALVMFWKRKRRDKV